MAGIKHAVVYFETGVPTFFRARVDRLEGIPDFNEYSISYEDLETPGTEVNIGYDPDGRITENYIKVDSNEVVFDIGVFNITMKRNGLIYGRVETIQVHPRVYIAYDWNSEVGQSSVLRVLNVDPTQRVYMESSTVSDEIVNLGFHADENAHIFEIRGNLPGWRHIYVEINRRMLSSNTRAIYLHPAEENLSSHEVIATPQMDVDEDLNAE